MYLYKYKYVIIILDYESNEFCHRYLCVWYEYVL